MSARAPTDEGQTAVTRTLPTRRVGKIPFEVETPEICQPNGNQKDSWESILPTDPLADFFAKNN